MTPRPRTAPVRPGDAQGSAIARQARALAHTMEAIAAFLGSAPVERTAADAVKTLGRDLTNAPQPADLVNALKELAARVGAAANELT